MINAFVINNYLYPNIFVNDAIRIVVDPDKQKEDGYERYM